jgi:hypothetical protein
LLLATIVSASSTAAPQAKGAAGTGKVARSDLTITMKVDKASPKLYRTVVPGAHSDESGGLQAPSPAQPDEPGLTQAGAAQGR